jgi:hypothetical protein
MTSTSAWLVASLDADGHIVSLRILPMPLGRDRTPAGDISRPLISEPRQTSRAVWALLVAAWGFADTQARVRALREFSRLDDALWCPLELARWTATTSGGRAAA